jgi:hypothetical protein
LASFDLPLYQRFSLLTETTFQQASAEHGVPLELLMVVREAVGYAQPGAEDLVAETDWWRTEIQTPQLASGMSEAEMLEVTNRWGEEMAALTERALLAIYHAQQEHAWNENFIREVEHALERSGLRSTRLGPRRCASSTSPATPGSPRNAVTRPRRSWRGGCPGWSSRPPSATEGRWCDGWATG